MSRFISHNDMTAVEIIACSSQAMAIIHLFEAVAWDIDSSNAVNLGDSIGCALRLVTDLLAPVHDALEMHEGTKNGVLAESA